MGTRPIPLAWGRGPLVDKDGNPTPMFLRWLSDHETMVRSTLQITSAAPGGPTTPTGQIQAAAPVAGRTEGIGTTVGGLAVDGSIKATTKVVGRTEGIGTTVQQLNSTGQLLSTDQIAADGTGSPLTGGKRGFQALDANNRIVSSAHNNVLNIAGAPTSSTGLSNDGTHTAITIAAVTQQFGDTTASYNSGSVDPGSFGGPTYIYASDPTRAGGAVTYQFTANPFTQVAADGNVAFGGITTVNGTSKTGGGFSGGTGGSGGGRGYNR